MLGLPEEIGLIDVSFYRDDFAAKGLHPQVKPTVIPFDVEGRHLILVDDVLYTGRTTRAALNELFDYGRPASVEHGGAGRSRRARTADRRRPTASGMLRWVRARAWCSESGTMANSLWRLENA